MAFDIKVLISKLWDRKKKQPVTGRDTDVTKYKIKRPIERMPNRPEWGPDSVKTPTQNYTPNPNKYIPQRDWNTEVEKNKKKYNINKA